MLHAFLKVCPAVGGLDKRPGVGDGVAFNQQQQLSTS
jgi:hypothetical protein